MQWLELWCLVSSNLASSRSHKLLARLFDGWLFSLYLGRISAETRLSLQFMDLDIVYASVVVAMLTKEARENKPMRLAAGFKVSCSSVPYVSLFVTEAECRHVELLKSDLCGGHTIVIHNEVYTAVMDVFFKARQKTFSWLESSNVLDRLQ